MPTVAMTRAYMVVGARILLLFATVGWLIGGVWSLVEQRWTPVLVANGVWIFFGGVYWLFNEWWGTDSR